MKDFFLPKRLCGFSEVGGDSYEAAEPRQTTLPNAEKKFADLAQQVEASKQSVETAQEQPTDASNETVQKALLRDQKNDREITRLPGETSTDGAIKMKLVEKPATAAYIEQTDHQELRDQFLALQNATRGGIQEALKAA